MFRVGHTPSWHESCSVLKAQHALKLKNLLFEQQEAKYDFSSRIHWHKMARSSGQRNSKAGTKFHIMR